MNATAFLEQIDAFKELDLEPEGVTPTPWLSRKRIVSLCLAVVLVVPISLLILVLIVAVRLTSPGPGLYRQRRLGRSGRPFTIYKLRSMRTDAEKASGPVWASTNDPRVTPIGSFLRHYHLDELPQIFNILKGEMSFVGPRPERPEIVQKLENDIPAYRDRLEALPGVTGLAQVNLPPDETFDCVQKKVLVDRFYIQNANLFLDAKLLAATLLRCFGLRYHTGAKLLRVSLEDLFTPQTTTQAKSSAPISERALSANQGDALAAQEALPSEFVAPRAPR